MTIQNNDLSENEASPYLAPDSLLGKKQTSKENKCPSKLEQVIWQNDKRRSYSEFKLIINVILIGLYTNYGPCIYIYI